MRFELIEGRVWKTLDLCLKLLSKFTC